MEAITATTKSARTPKLRPLPKLDYWGWVRRFVATNDTMTITDPLATNFNSLFYRVLTS